MTDTATQQSVPPTDIVRYRPLITWTTTRHKISPHENPSVKTASAQQQRTAAKYTWS